jgi:23S rRNA (adenine2503-C2)-methyltransferase
MDVTTLKGLSLSELEKWVSETTGEKPYRARQLYKWMYQKWSRDFEEMTDIAKPLREKLAETASLDALEFDEVIESTDGTRKLIFRVPRVDNKIEAVWIPSEARVTLCISSQVGCAFGCEFCLTAKMGLWGHLTAGEIVDQVVWARRLFEKERRLSNIVFMGMGEPLHNYDAVVQSIRLLIDDNGLNFSHRKITVSTVGLVPALERVGAEDITFGLAVSLNATTDDVRDQLMPINRKYPIDVLISALAKFPLPKRRRITIEYVMLAGVNDSDDDARRLARLLKPIPSKVNLIPFNPHPGSEFTRPSKDRVQTFRQILVDRHYNCMVRETRGDDTLAACGQLGGGVDGRVQRRLPRH